MIALVASLLLAWPAAPQGTLQQAVAAYRAGDYEAALQRFAELVRVEADAGRRAVLHADAGTAAARAERLGEALWHLEAACRLAPRDEVAARNLEQLRVRLGEGSSEAAQFTTTLLRIPLLLTPAESEQAVGAVLALGLLLLAARRARWMRWRSGRWGLALLLLALGTNVYTDVARRADLRRAVVIPDALPLRAEPDRSGEILYRLSAGAVVSDEETRRGWRLVQTAQGARGWAPEADIRPAGR